MKLSQLQHKDWCLKSSVWQWGWEMQCTRDILCRSLVANNHYNRTVANWHVGCVFECTTCTGVSWSSEWSQSHLKLRLVQIFSAFPSHSLAWCSRTSWLQWFVCHKEPSPSILLSNSLPNRWNKSFWDSGKGTSMSCFLWHDRLPDPIHFLMFALDISNSLTWSEHKFVIFSRVCEKQRSLFDWSPCCWRKNWACCVVIGHSWVLWTKWKQACLCVSGSFTWNYLWDKKRREAGSSCCHYGLQCVAFGCTLGHDCAFDSSECLLFPSQRIYGIFVESCVPALNHCFSCSVDAVLDQAFYLSSIRWSCSLDAFDDSVWSTVPPIILSYTIQQD